MKIKSASFLLTSAAALFSSQANAQVHEMEVSDGTTSVCYGTAGANTCTSSFTKPTVDIFVSDGAGSSSEIQTNVTGTRIETTDAATGSTSATLTEGNKAGVVTTNAAGETNTVEVDGVRTLIGFSPAGTRVVKNGLMANTAGVYLIGNATASADFTVVGGSTLNGVNNQNAGITNAGLVSGVTAAALTATSTEAVNGAQLFTTNTNVTTAQATANTAVSNAAAAQTSANSALTNAATAQTSADNALSSAVAAQTTANSALTNAAAAQTTANTALSNAATAQTTAETAQTTANTALTAATTSASAATTAQATADTALANAATAQTTASAADIKAVSAQEIASAADVKATAAETNANTALTTANGIASTANTALSTANTALSTAQGFDSRITNVENTVKNFSADIADAKNTAKRGTAIATAMASIPDVDYGKKMAVGVGVGTYQGKTAFAIGVSGRASENVRLRLNVGTSEKGSVAFGAGGTYSW